MREEFKTKTAAIEIIKKCDWFKEWDGKTKPDFCLIQFTYDFLCPYETKLTKELKHEITKFLRWMKTGRENIPEFYVIDDLMEELMHDVKQL